MNLYDYLLLTSEEKAKAIQETLEHIGQNLKWYQKEHKYTNEAYAKLLEKYDDLVKENEKLKTKLTSLQNKSSKGTK